MIYPTLFKNSNHKKYFSLLIDPEKSTEHSIIKSIELAKILPVDYILVGGSLITNDQSIDQTIETIKKYCNIPVIIFPGSYHHVSNKADGILLLNLISGRNPDYLIGHHVLAADSLKKSGLEVIPTAYILIENGRTTSVEYISNTRPIPADKHDIIISTAIAGELMGNKLIYLEAGSGAKQHISFELVEKVKKNIEIPLIVGGGIRNKATMEKLYEAGADMVVIGNALEKNPDLIQSFFTL